MLEVFCRVSAEVSPQFIENFPTQFDFSGMLEKICEDVGVTVSLINNNCTLEGQWGTIGRAHNMLVSTLAVYGSSSAVRKEHEDLVSQGSRPFSALVEAAEAISRGVELQEQVQNEMMHMKGMTVTHIPVPQLQNNESLKTDYQDDSIVTADSFNQAESDSASYKNEPSTFPALERILTSEEKVKLSNVEESKQTCSSPYVVSKHGYDEQVDNEWLGNTDNEEVEKENYADHFDVVPSNVEESDNNDTKSGGKNKKSATVKKSKKKTKHVEIHNETDNDQEPEHNETNASLTNTDNKTKKTNLSCNICSFVGKNRNSLMDHKARKHNATHVKCDICQEVFQNIRYLKRHMVSHDKTRQNKCKICGKTYKLARALNKHMKQHDKSYVAQKYSCDHCEKEFSSQYILQCHFKSEHEGIKKSFLCQVCGKSFTTKHTLQQHDNVHSGNRPFKCEDCGKAFSYESALRDHRYIHEGKKKFVCAYDGCEKAFRQRSSLKMHEKIHNNERDHKCNECGREFTQKQALQRHLRSHKGFKPFSCKHCQKKFGDAAVIRRHMKLVHRIHKDVNSWREDVEILKDPDSEEDYLNEQNDVNESEDNKSTDYMEEESSPEFHLASTHENTPVRLPPVTAIHNFQMAKPVPDNHDAAHLTISEPVNMFSIPPQEYMMSTSAPVIPYSYSIPMDTPNSMNINCKTTVMPVNCVISDGSLSVPDSSVMHHLNQITYSSHIRNHHITDIPVPHLTKSSALVSSEHESMHVKLIPYSVDIPMEGSSYSNLLVVNSKHSKSLDVTSKLDTESNKQREGMDKEMVLQQKEVKSLESTDSTADNLSFTQFYDNFPIQY